MKLAPIWPGVLAHASGGLWLEESETLVLADLHLGYGWAQRRRGQLGPLVDHETRAKMIHALDEIKPRKLLLLGDIVHAPEPGPDESAWITSTLREMLDRAELVCVEGNHDRQFEADFEGLGIPLVAEWRVGSLRAIHGDRMPNQLPIGQRLIIGHLHPAIGLEDAAGVRHRVPAFLIAGPVVVLPAFSPFATGLDVWRDMPGEVAELSGGAAPEVIAATGSRAVALGPLARLVSPALGTRPANYRAGRE